MSTTFSKLASSSLYTSSMCLSARSKSLRLRFHLDRTIPDWEVQAAYLAYQRRYRTKQKALEMMSQEYGQNIPTLNLHLIMGTMAKRRWQFILIGLLRSGLNPEGLGKQGRLF